MIVLLEHSSLSSFTNSVFVTGLAKTGHVGTNNTLSHNGSYLSTGTEYLHSITCIINI